MTSCQPFEVLKISEGGVSASGVESKGSHAEAQRRGQCRSRQPLRTLRLCVKLAFEFRDSTSMAKSGKSKTQSCFSSPPKRISKPVNVVVSLRETMPNPLIHVRLSSRGAGGLRSRRSFWLPLHADPSSH